VKVSYFPHLFAPGSEMSSADLTWEGLIAFLHPHRIVPVPGGDEEAAKKSIPLFSPCEFVPGAPKKSWENAIALHFGVIDFDHLDDDRSHRLAEVLAGESCAWILYSTWSHSLNGEAAYRLVVPLSRPILRGDWKERFWPRLVARFGNVADRACKDPNRGYFLPSCPPERAHLATFHVNPGEALDVDAIMGTEIPVLSVIEQRKEPVNRTALQGLLARLRRKKSPIAEPFASVLNGEPWAPKSQRDSTLWAITGEIVREFPSADMETIAAEFVPSVQRIVLDDPTTHISLRVVLDKLLRRQAEAIEEEQAKERDSIRDRQARIRAAFRGNRENPYTEEELDAFASAANVDRYSFGRRWIVQVASSFYFFIGGSYVGPYPKEPATAAARTLLAPACSAGVELDTRTLLGGLSPKNIDTLVLEYGSVARHIIADMLASVTYFDPAADAMIEATCPVRPIVPTFHPAIDQWLGILGGSESEALRTWIAYVLDLDLPCAALYMEGAPGSGKSLLAKGLARLWREGPPTMLEQVFGNWNDSLAKCPLVFADEVMPANFAGKAKTGELRAFIQEESRPLRRRYTSDGVLRGCARVIIAANNRGMLAGEDNLTSHDVEAIAGRILHIEAPKAATEYLESVDTSGWVSGDMIAEHAAWIWANTLKPKHPPRFLVQSIHGGKIHRALTTGTVMGSAVCHWLTSFLLRPEQLRAGAPPTSSAHMARVWETRLHVNVRAIVEQWDRYPTNVDVHRATAGALGKALAAISDREKIQRRACGSRIWFHVVRTEDLIEWASSNGYADETEIRERLAAWQDT
jgi:hypothetical protein